MIRTVIVDDEKPSRDVLSNYLKEYCPDVEVVATAGSLKLAFRIIRKQQPDLVFLDIELGDGKGFDLLNLFEKLDFKVVFVTAYSEHAVRAFRYSAVDYLLKPIKIDELKEAVDKVRNFNGTSVKSEHLATFFSNLNNSNRTLPTLVIPHLKGYEILRIADIIMCKADGYCTNFYLTGNRKIVSSKNLKQYEELLSEHHFMRIHHSFVINLNYVSSYTKQGEVILAENNKASLGDAYKDGFIGRFTRR